MAENIKILLHYTDGSLAQIGDRVQFQHHYGYQGTSCYRGQGTLHSVSREAMVSIDISPNSYMEDCGRFGTKASHLFTIHAQYNWQLGKETLPDGSFGVHYTISKPQDGWSLDHLVRFEDFIAKI